jgi:hypothetical protein
MAQAGKADRVLTAVDRGGWTTMGGTMLDVFSQGLFQQPTISVAIILARQRRARA